MINVTLTARLIDMMKHVKQANIKNVFSPTLTIPTVNGAIPKNGVVSTSWTWKTSTSNPMKTSKAVMNIEHAIIRLRSA